MIVTTISREAGKFFGKKRTAVNTRMKYDFPFSSFPFPFLYVIDILFFSSTLDIAPEWRTSRIIDSRLDGRTGNHFQDPEKPQDKDCRKSYSAVEIIINEGFRARLE